MLAALPLTCLTPPRWSCLWISRWPLASYPFLFRNPIQMQLNKIILHRGGPRICSPTEGPHHKPYASLVYLIKCFTPLAKSTLIKGLTTIGFVYLDQMFHTSCLINIDHRSPSTTLPMFHTSCIVNIDHRFPSTTLGLVYQCFTPLA
jgi:hypothetical protein